MHMVSACALRTLRLLLTFVPRFPLLRVHTEVLPSKLLQLPIGSFFGLIFSYYVLWDFTVEILDKDIDG